MLKNGMIQPKGYNSSVTAQASVAIGSRLLDDPFTHLTASANIALWFATDARQETAGWIAVLDEARTRAIASNWVDCRHTAERRAAGMGEDSRADILAASAAEQLTKTAIPEVCIVGYIDARTLEFRDARPNQMSHTIEHLTPNATHAVASQLCQPLRPLTPPSYGGVRVFWWV